MQILNYLIVDDEPQARKLLQAYMATLNQYRLAKECSNAIEAYEALQTLRIDLIFLDIKMPLLSGTDFLRSLKNPPMVIFTTAYNKYAMEGYDLNVVDYLLKPIALPRLLSALDKVTNRVQTNTTATQTQQASHIFIKSENKLVKISFADILLIEGMQNYVKIHLAEKVIIAAYTMKALEAMLPGEKFLRVHKSFIVAINTIIAINGNNVETTYQNIPIGVSFKNAVLKYVNRI